MSDRVLTIAELGALLDALPEDPGLLVIAHADDAEALRAVMRADLGRPVRIEASRMGPEHPKAGQVYVLDLASVNAAVGDQWGDWLLRGPMVCDCPGVAYIIVGFCPVCGGLRAPAKPVRRLVDVTS